MNSVSFKFSDDMGKLMENLVFIELKRRNAEVYYHRNKYECDFLIKEKNRVVATIQVTKQLDDDNYKREINGLVEAMDTHGLKKGTIITEDKDDKISIEGKEINIIPIWKWLLLEKKN